MKKEDCALHRIIDIFDNSFIYGLRDFSTITEKLTYDAIRGMPPQDRLLNEIVDLLSEISFSIKKRSFINEIVTVEMNSKLKFLKISEAQKKRYVDKTICDRFNIIYNDNVEENIIYVYINKPIDSPISLMTDINQSITINANGFNTLSENQNVLFKRIYKEQRKKLGGYIEILNYNI